MCTDFSFCRELIFFFCAASRWTPAHPWPSLPALPSTYTKQQPSSGGSWRVYLSIYVCLYIYMYVCIYCINIYVSIHVCIHVCVCVCVCMCVYLKCINTNRFVAPAVGIIPVHESESVNAQLHASASSKFNNVTGLYLTPNLGPFENCQTCMQAHIPKSTPDSNFCKVNVLGR